ncbi:MAG TPA: threonine synthase [Chloroflexota bacterium]|nr:threonine synthase [Chloroflexota bacterium]
MKQERDRTLVALVVPTLVQRYRPFLPVTDATPALTLGEGDTPLLHARHLGPAIGCDRLYLKFEGTNPTGSFKDRGMVLAVARARERGAAGVICASTGNTAASAAAYAAAAGMACSVILPAGHVAPGKLAQALLYGARVVPIDGSFDDALALVRRLAESPEVELVNSLNPYRLDGQKTAAFEISDALGGAPDVVALPVGNAGNITAYWKGFREYREAGRVTAAPAMWGFQAAGAAPLVTGRPVEAPETVASAIRIGRPARGAEALAAVAESAGLLEAVSDEQILEAYRLVACREGVMCEPASAAPLAGLLKLARNGRDLSGLTIVAVLTGHGLKDPATALASFPALEEVPADLDAVLEVMAVSA